MTFNFNGDTIDDLLIQDQKEGSTWNTPMDVTTMSFTISDSYPNIYFYTAHNVGTLTVSGTYCVGSFENMKIGSMTYNVEVGSLLVKQNSAYPVNKVVVSTRDGSHCVTGATVNTADSNCPNQGSRDLGFFRNYIDTTSYCQSDMYVCSDSAASCPASGTAISGGQASFTITVDDGPVHFYIADSTNTAQSSYLPTFDNFAITSQIQLDESFYDFSSQPSDPRMYLYEIISPGYKKMWVHSPLKQYIEARPWFLSMLSLSILKPVYHRHTLIHIPSKCPMVEPTNVRQNTLVYQQLANQSFVQSSHIFVQKANNTYYTFEYTAKGEYMQTEIPFLGNNIFILLCLVVSGLLALYSVIAVCLIIVRLKWQFERMIQQYLTENRRFAIAKKEIQHKNDETKTKLVTAKSNKRIIKILKMGLLTTKIKHKHIDYNEDDEDEAKLKQKVKKKISLSFFQTPVLYLEHIRRMRVNSFKMFLDNIYESPAHFPKWKLKSENSWRSTSVRIDQLDPLYLEFCTKEGLKPKVIEDEKKLFQEYNLILEWKIDNSTDAYTNIRWKTPLEKLEDAEAVKLGTSTKKTQDVMGNEENIIAKFLNSECCKSSFKRDFILVEELKKRYDRFCKEKKIDDLVKINIVGCAEMEQFGAFFDSNLYIPYLSGIALTKIPGLKNKHYVPGIIRIPKESKARKRNVGFATKCKNKIIHLLFSGEGILTNLLVVFIHLVLLIGVPFLIFLALTWSLLQINVINSDIHEVTYDLYDVFNASTYDFWLYDLRGVTAFYVMGGLCGYFFLSGLIELISFYATGARDTGKYIVSKTWPKWFTTVSFWFILSLFICMYTAYVTVILVWCILGAVLNPEKFLPMAVGAIVVILFAYLIYTRVKYIHKTLEGAVGDAVDKELKMAMVETIKIEQIKIKKLRNPTVDMLTQNQFHKAINSYMLKNNYPTVHKDVTDDILDGDMGQLMEMMNKHCGIDKNVGYGLVGWLKQDATLIMDCIHKLTNELGQDIGLNMVVTEIALDAYNPDSVGVNQAQGTIILSLKKLFRKAFPQFPLETLDGLLQVVSEGDPRPLYSIIDKLNIPKPLFNLATGFVMNEEKQIEDSIKDLTGDILPEHYKRLFDSLYTIFKGNPKAGLEDLAKNLDIEHEFLLQFIVAVTKQDNSLIRYALSKSVDQIFDAVENQGININDEDAHKLKNFLLSIYTLSRGSEFNMVDLVKEGIPGLDPYVCNLFYEASKGNINKFDLILDSLGLIIQKKSILEFCHLLFERDVDLVEISGRLGIFTENSGILHAAIRLVITTGKYFTRVKPKLDEMKNQSIKVQKLERTQITEALLEISDSLKKFLNVLYQAEVLELKPKELDSKIIKIGSFIKELFYETTGDPSFREPNQYKDLDLENPKEAIAAATNSIVQKVLKGDQKIMDQIITKVLDFFEFNTDKKNYFKAICSMVTAFIVDVTLKEIDDDADLLTAFKMISLLLEVDEEHLEFILDVFSGNPYRIFSCNTPNPEINLKTNEIAANFNTERLGILADVLNASKRQVKKLSAIWIHSYKLVQRGENFIRNLGIDRLGIDPMFFHFLIKKCNPTYNRIHQISDIDFYVSISKFLEIHFQRARANVESGFEKSEFFFNGLRIEEEEDYGTKDDPGLSDLPPNHEL